MTTLVIVLTTFHQILNYKIIEFFTFSGKPETDYARIGFPKRDTTSYLLNLLPEKCTILGTQLGSI